MIHPSCSRVRAGARACACLCACVPMFCGLVLVLEGACKWPCCANERASGCAHMSMRVPKSGRARACIRAVRRSLFSSIFIPAESRNIFHPRKNVCGANILSPSYHEFKCATWQAPWARLDPGSSLLEVEIVVQRTAWDDGRALIRGMVPRDTTLGSRCGRAGSGRVRVVGV